MEEPIALEIQQRLAQAGSRYFLSVSVKKSGSELAHALRLLGVAWRSVETREGVCSATLSGVGDESPASAHAAAALPGEEGYAVVPQQNGSLLLVARTEHALANGLYSLRRGLISAPSDPTLKACDLMAPGISNPKFAQRDTYQFLSPWRLPRLSCDALTLPEWRTHLDRMRALNVRRWYFDIWADQYYHPDRPETNCNRELYDRMKIVAAYAHELGMRTGVYLFPAQIPVSVYTEDQRVRAVEARNYHGINGCPSNAWDDVIRFDLYLLNYFGSSIDDVAIEFQDPGSCLCPECCRAFPDIVLRFIRAYRDIPAAAGRRIDLCSLHFRDWLEDPGIKQTGGSFSIPGLRSKVFGALPRETTLIDIDDPTLDMGASLGFRRNYFFFDLDPESGIENQQVFPRVKLRRIESQVLASVERGHDGVTAYRMMPFTQYVADYVLFRKLWDPAIPIHEALADLAAEWGVPAGARVSFVEAMRDLDAWWEDQNVESLKRAATALEGLAAGSPGTALHDLADTVAVLLLLGVYLAANPERVREDDFYPSSDLVNRVRARMLQSRMFEAYTVHQHWVVRSEEMIGQRIRWWLKGIDSELRAVLPAGAL